MTRTTTIAAAALAMLLAAPVAADEMVLTSEVPVSHWKTRYMEEFKRLVEERTGGELTVSIFPGGQLYADADAVSALGTGAVQMVWPVSVNLETVEPRAGIITLPFTLTDELMTKPAFAGAFTGMVSDLLEPRSIELLGIMRAADAIFIFKDLEVRKPEDLAGKKIRVTGGKILLDAINRLGASPISLPASEMSSAFEQGVIDGIFTSPSGWSRIIGESAQEAALIPGLSLLTYSIVVDKAWLDGLPPEQATAVREATASIVEKQWQEAIKADAAEVQSMVDKGAGYWEASPAETEVWKAKAAPALEGFTAQYRDTYDAFQALVQQHGS